MSDPSQTIPAGTLLADRYQVRRELGRGGMGTVYLCRDLVTDDRVAVKLLCHPGSSVRPEESWWFHEEARALAGLAHPVIVRARDFGTTADGVPYLAMDAVPGRSLHEWIYLSQFDGLLPWPIIWFTIDAVLSSLAHAHARGVIHGDLKPSNVLLDIPSDGSDPGVHVLDLGLAWLMKDRVDHRLDGSVEAAPTVRWGAGTPGWMAPEQIRFATPHIGPATDLYALGCILFALLTGKEPYAGSNEELLEAHRNAPIPEPSLPPGAPDEAAAFVKRLIAKRPWQRYDFAGDARRVWRKWKPDSSVTTPIPRSAGTVLTIRPTRDEITLPDRFDGTAPTAPTIATGLLGLRPSPFVARADERRRLLQMVADVIDACDPSRARRSPAAAAASSRHRLVVLSGDAGVGKSRLAEWLCEETHERALMLPLRARYRKIAAPLDGMIGAVMQHYRLERETREVIERVLINHWNVNPGDHEALTWVAATAEWLRPTQPGEKVGPSGKRFALDRAELRWLVIRRTLTHMGRDRPLLLWMDDLHYASQSTFEGITRLHRDAKDLGLLVVVTARSEAVESDPVAAARLDKLISDWGGERVTVAPLAAEESHALLRETLPLADEAVAEAAARSKGNPLFALQIVHSWALGGQLEMRGGRYVVPAEHLAARPKTTAELWEERLGAMPPELRITALAAAALGGDIRRDVLRLQLLTLGHDADRAIGSLRRAQVLLASGADRLRWPHALLQEYLLTQLLAEESAPAIFRAAAEALAHHPLEDSRRIVRHRVTCLVRAGDVLDAATLLHGSIAAHWKGTRDPSATLRDLALLDGKLDGWPAALHLRWRGEALRHAGRFEDARRDTEEARRIFNGAGDLENEAACLRLLGHIASELAAPAHGRRLVARALTIFEDLGVDLGRAECELTLGEIDYLLGDHGRARSELASASARFAALGERLGRAQCLILQSFVEQAGGSALHARQLLGTARNEFEAIGYRLGMAQTDVALGHVEHREGRFDLATAVALGARQAFRDLAVPRGEAAAERLLAMSALDSGEVDACEEHARGALELFDRLADPWGQVEARLLLAQVALDRGDGDGARDELISCEAVALAEAEPKQHRHLTLAWLAYHDGRFVDASRELDLARAAFKDAGRTGDHTRTLLERFERMAWPKPAGGKVATWLKAILLAARPSGPVLEELSP